MRRMIAILSVMAIATLAASAAQAGFVYGDYYFQFDNWGNGGDDNSTGPAWVLPTGPTATTDGAIWIKTGNTYVLDASTDFNAEIDFKESFTAAPVVITNTYLLSTGVAWGDVSIGSGGEGYAGYFMGFDGATGWGNNHPDTSSPYRMVSNGNGMYYVPTDGNANAAQFEFDVKIWLGNYNSFAAAQVAGADVADSGWFLAGTMAEGTSPIPQTTFANMPSLTLQPAPTPEPSTLLLTATGLAGLLAYAWRRRR